MHLISAFKVEDGLQSDRMEEREEQLKAEVKETHEYQRGSRNFSLGVDAMKMRGQGKFSGISERPYS